MVSCGRGWRPARPAGANFWPPCAASEHLPEKSIPAQESFQISARLILSRIACTGCCTPFPRLEVEVFAEIGGILLGHGLCPTLTTLIGSLSVVKLAVEADPQVGPALRATLAAPREVPEGPKPTAPVAVSRHGRQNRPPVSQRKAQTRTIPAWLSNSGLIPEQILLRLENALRIRL